MVHARACIPERQFARLSRGTGRRKANHILAVYRLAAHQEVIIGYLVLLFFNIFGILFMIYRQFFFKDTGKKLKHLEKQLDSEATDLITELDRDR